MTTNVIYEKLVALGADKLANILIEHSCQDRILESKINLAVLKNDPNKLSRSIKSKISGIMRRKPCFARSHASELETELSNILDSITEDLFPEKPRQAISILEDLLNKANKIHENIDDSYGCVGEFFRRVSKQLGKFWIEIEDRDTEHLAKQVFESILSNDYGEKDNLITDMAEALGCNGLDKLKAIFITRREEYEDQYCKIDLPLKEIADAKNDPDEFILLTSDKPNLQAYEICEISKRLILHNRGKEAIEWLLEKPNSISIDESHHCDLNKINPYKRYESERYDLLLSAYKQGGHFVEAERLSWKLFELTFSKKYYDIATERKSEDEIAVFKDKAISLIIGSTKVELSTRLNFLEQINEFEFISKLILSNHNQINKEHYQFYRPLSTKLHENGQSLSACILRRKLVDGILEKTQSKYYSYAVSDLSCAKTYAAHVNDWQEFENHGEYMLSLKQNHGRKPSFWGKVQAKKLDG